MEKLKDFFYDKNDLVVALIIIVVTAFLITWRVNAIMEYPQVLAAEAAEVHNEEIQVSGGEPADNAADGSSASNGSANSGSASNGSASNGSANGGTGIGTPPAIGTSPAIGADPGTAKPNTTPAAKPNTNGSNSGNASGTASGGTLTITIPSGSSSDQIAQILVDAGAVSSKSDFISAVTAANADRKLKAGTFKVPSGSSLAEVVAIITR